MRKVTGWTILKDAARGGLASDEVMRRIQSAGWDAARPLILWAYRHVQRGLVAAIELRVDRELERAEEPQDRVSIRQRLAEKTFALPTGETVYWSLATDEQHDARGSSAQEGGRGDSSGGCLLPRGSRPAGNENQERAGPCLLRNPAVTRPVLSTDRRCRVKAKGTTKPTRGAPHAAPPTRSRRGGGLRGRATHPWFAPSLSTPSPEPGAWRPKA